MKNFSLISGGVLVAILGPILINTIGFTEACSNEITGKVVEYIPLLIGGAMSWIGGVKSGAMTKLGGKKVV